MVRLLVTHTDAADKVVEEGVGEQRLRKLPEVHLQSSSGHVDVLPLPVLQVHLLVWTHTNTSVVENTHFHRTLFKSRRRQLTVIDRKA